MCKAMASEGSGKVGGPGGIGTQQRQSMVGAPPASESSTQLGAQSLPQAQTLPVQSSRTSGYEAPGAAGVSSPRALESPQHSQTLASPTHQGPAVVPSGPPSSSQSTQPTYVQSSSSSNPALHGYMGVAGLQEAMQHMHLQAASAAGSTQHAAAAHGASPVGALHAQTQAAVQQAQHSSGQIMQQLGPQQDILQDPRQQSQQQEAGRIQQEGVMEEHATVSVAACPAVCWHSFAAFAMLSI